MTTAPTYDPATCITAAELRAMGIAVTANVPDCGWIPRDSMRMKSATPTSTPDEIAQGILAVNLEVEFTQPFHWIEVEMTVEKK